MIFKTEQTHCPPEADQPLAETTGALDCPPEADQPLAETTEALDCLTLGAVYALA